MRIRLVSLLLSFALSACLDARTGSRSEDTGATMPDLPVDTAVGTLDTASSDADPLNADLEPDSSPDLDTGPDPDSSPDLDTGFGPDSSPDPDSGPNLDTDADQTTSTCDCDYGAESGCTPCSTVGDACHREGFPGDEGTIYTCAPPLQVGRTCANQFNEFYHPCADGLSCLPQLPDDDDTVRRCLDCRPQDFSVTGDCEMAIGVFWDGQSCAMYSGCSCDGAACSAPYPSLEHCQAAAAYPCAERSP